VFTVSRRDVTMAGKLEDVRDEAKEFMGRVERKAASAGKSVSDAAVNVRGRVEEMAGDVDLAAARRAVRRETRAHPFRALLVATVIGLVLGRLLAGKRN
jgi:ElaB/YqjD/DUF883 family membrane-anchored ribosome-binding protein